MNFLFTCGGTAGHINPAIAVAGILRERMPDCGILFVGAQGHMETDLVPRAGFDIKTVTITNISREKSLAGLKHNLETARNVLSATGEAKRIIEDFKPDAVIGTGGYVCYPVLSAARKMNVKTALHESNAVPGLTTKLLADRVDLMMVGFEDSREHYSHGEKVSVTGTPVRGEFKGLTCAGARAQLGIPAGKPLVASVWGSLGARRMNELMTEIISDGAASFSLIHAAGSCGYAGMIGALEERAGDYAARGFDVRKYIYDMPCVMAAADLIVCRAGASTLAELTYMGKPAILVPSPNVTNNHQEKNARVLEKAGAARVLLEEGLTAEGLLNEITALLSDKSGLAAMSSAMRSLAVSDAAERIAAEVLNLVK